MPLRQRQEIQILPRSHKKWLQIPSPFPVTFFSSGSWHDVTSARGSKAWAIQSSARIFRARNLSPLEISSTTRHAGRHSLISSGNSPYRVLKPEWFQAEKEKPEPDQHPLFQLQQLAFKQLKAQQIGGGLLNSASTTGAIEQFFRLAYHLYLVSHNGGLPDVPVARSLEEGPVSRCRA